MNVSLNQRSCTDYMLVSAISLMMLLTVKS